MDGLANFNMLRERLGKAEDKTILMHLEMIRMNALEEFRKLTQYQTLTLDGITYDAVKRHSLSVEKKERVVFSLGWECIKETNSAARDKFLDTDITLRRLDTQPNCALLHVLAMIENVTDGDGAMQVIPIRYNFRLIDDNNGVFKDLITKIPLFYPKVPIGTVDNVEGEAKPANVETSDVEPANVETSDVEADAGETLAVGKLLTSQLLARHHFLGDTQSYNEFNRRMEACGISKDKAEAYMESDIEIITRLDKRFLTEPEFIKTWFVKLDETNLKKDSSEYLTDRELTISEISKIFDEINWHGANSSRAPWKLDAWLQIGKLSFKGKDPFLNVAVTTLTLIGWSFAEAHRYLFNENKLILNVRWGMKTPQIPFTLGVDNPQNAAIKKEDLPKTDQAVVDVYKEVLVKKKSNKNQAPATPSITNAVKCDKCYLFYDSKRFEQCPYCNPKSADKSNENPQEQNETSTGPSKRKTSISRIIFLVLAIYNGFGILLIGIVAFENTEALYALFGLVPWFAFFLWLYLRKGKKR